MSDQSVTAWIGRLRGGDEEAARRLWERYQRPLLDIARKRLGDFPARAADEEDAVLAAMNSVFRRVEAGQVPQLDDRHDLWLFLLHVTECKVRDVVLRPELAKKRGGGKVRGDSAFTSANGSRSRGMDEFASSQPSPAFLAELAETRRHLLDVLDDDSLRNVAVLRWDGHDNSEIAGLLRCAKRTVERKLTVIRELWERELAHA